MGLFLQILGALFLMMMITVVMLFLVIRAKARQFLKNLSTLSENVQRRTAPPSRIQLVPMAVNDWNDPGAVKAQADPLADLGFLKVGDFEVQPVQGFLIEAWVKPAEAVTAVVYEHSDGEVWLEVSTDFEDGSRLTFNNAPLDEVGYAPGHQVEQVPGLAPAELYRRFLAARPERPVKVCGPNDFVAAFEKAYADDADWRSSRRGPTETELRAVAALSHQPLPNEEQAEARGLLEFQTLDALGQALRERFLATSGISAAEWERVRDRVIVIHDKLTDELVSELLYEYGDEDDVEQFEFESDEPVRKRFVAYNAELPADRQFRLLGVVEEPIEASVYCAPE